MINISLEEEQASSARLVAAVRLGTRTSQTAFRALLDALARPGLVVRLPANLLATDVPAPLLVPLALADLDVRVAVTGAPEALAWTRVVAEATGGRPCAQEAADILVSLGTPEPERVLELRRGRPEAPEDAARLAVGCRRLSDGTDPAALLVEVTGPGVPGTRRFGVDGIDADLFAALAEANATFPMGVDTWLLADNGAVVGLPRSTRIRVVERPAVAGTEEN